jgi:hypothetical protein
VFLDHIADPRHAFQLPEEVLLPLVVNHPAECALPGLCSMELLFYSRVIVHHGPCYLDVHSLPEALQHSLSGSSLNL